MKTDKPYKLIQRKGRKIQVRFAHLPGKELSTGTTDLLQAVRWADNFVINDGIALKKKEIPTLSQFAKDFFTMDPYGIKMRDAAHNHDLDDQHYIGHQGRLENYILPKFGAYLITSITDIAIEDWYLSMRGFRKGERLADDTKNKVLRAFDIVMSEAKRQGFISNNPIDNVDMINPKNRGRGNFNEHELAKLFPQDDTELLTLWGGLMWACYFLVMRDTGFRPSEVAGLMRDNYYPEYHGVFTMQGVHWRTRRIKQSIKTTKKGQKYKVGILTARTCMYLDELIKDMPQDELIFMIKKRGKIAKPIIPDTANKNLRSVLRKLDISRNGRTQYSFRHSFETDVIGEIAEADMLRLMGHTSYRGEYDHRSVEKMLKQLAPVRAVLEDRSVE